jgi:predicted enzyme related to lactoylglutathione lyase
MSSVRIEQKSYEMPPRDGFTVTHFITVANIDRSADFYEKVFGGGILREATARLRLGTFRSRILGRSSTSEAAHPGQAVDDAQRPRRPG